MAVVFFNQHVHARNRKDGKRRRCVSIHKSGKNEYVDELLIFDKTGKNLVASVHYISQPTEDIRTHDVVCYVRIHDAKLVKIKEG